MGLGLCCFGYEQTGIFFYNFAEVKGLFCPTPFSFRWQKKAGDGTDLNTSNNATSIEKEDVTLRSLSSEIRSEGTALFRDLEEGGIFSRGLWSDVKRGVGLKFDVSEI